MTYVRGHYRKPYRRSDGTKVKGAMVRAHHRNTGRGKKRQAPGSRRRALLSQGPPTWRPPSRPPPTRVVRARQVCDDDWQLQLLRAARRRIDADTWSTRPKRCRASDCRRYAALANELLQARLATPERAADLLLAGASDRSRRAFAPLVARCIVINSPLPTDQALAQAARCLRALGVLCCVASGRKLARCQCLLDVASAFSDDALTSELRHMVSDALWSPSP